MSSVNKSKTETSKNVKNVVTPKVNVKSKVIKSTLASDSESDEELETKINKKSTVESEEESEVESDAESDSDDESDNEKTIQSENESEKQKDKEKKEKLRKLSHKELTSSLISNEDKITEIISKLNEHDAQIKLLEREQTNLRKANVKFIKLLDKAHEESIKVELKKKKKRNTTENSGILRNKPIPSILISFLGIEAGTELPRTKIMSLLCNKFNSLGLRKGQNIHLDKATAKIFGKEDGYIIEFKYFQRFLKEIYEQLETDNTVSI